MVDETHISPQALIKNVIPITVTDRQVKLDASHLKPVQGNISHDYISIKLDEEWEGLTYVVVFKNTSSGEVIETEWDGTSDIEIPWEIIQSTGNIEITVVGSDTGVDRLITQAVESGHSITIARPGTYEGESGDNPESVDILFKVVKATQDANGAAKKADDVVADIEKKLANGEFNGPKGDKGDPGEQGIQGPKGDKGDPGEPGKDASVDDILQIGMIVEDAMSSYKVDLTKYDIRSLTTTLTNPKNNDLLIRTVVIEGTLYTQLYKLESNNEKLELIKLADNINDMSLDQAVSTDKILDLAVTTEKIMDQAVSYDKIMDQAVRTDRICDLAVTTEKIMDQAVSYDKIMDQAVSYDKIANGAVVGPKLGIANKYTVGGVKVSSDVTSTTSSQNNIGINNSDEIYCLAATDTIMGAIRYDNVTLVPIEKTDPDLTLRVANPLAPQDSPKSLDDSASTADIVAAYNGLLASLQSAGVLIPLDDDVKKVYPIINSYSNTDLTLTVSYTADRNLDITLFYFYDTSNTEVPIDLSPLVEGKTYKTVLEHVSGYDIMGYKTSSDYAEIAHFTDIFDNGYTFTFDSSMLSNTFIRFGNTTGTINSNCLYKFYFEEV